MYFKGSILGGVHHFQGDPYLLYLTLSIFVHGGKVLIILSNFVVAVNTAASL